MILAGLSYLFNSWFSLACITSFPFITLFSYWCVFVQIAKCICPNVFVQIVKCKLHHLLSLHYPFLILVLPALLPISTLLWIGSSKHLVF